MSESEWEALCDGCGRCCLQKLEDEKTGEIHFTDIACRLLDTGSCRCQHYAKRFDYVVDCLSVRPLTAEKLSWLPSSCAYKRVANKQPLAPWHPLVSGTQDSVHQAGVGLSNRCVSEESVPVAEWMHHIVIFDS